VDDIHEGSSTSRLSLFGRLGVYIVWRALHAAIETKVISQDAFVLGLKRLSRVPGSARFSGESDDQMPGTKDSGVRYAAARGS